MYSNYCQTAWNQNSFVKKYSTEIAFMKLVSIISSVRMTKFLFKLTHLAFRITKYNKYNKEHASINGKIFQNYFKGCLKVPAWVPFTQFIYFIHMSIFCRMVRLVIMKASFFFLWTYVFWDICFFAFAVCWCWSCSFNIFNYLLNKYEFSWIVVRGLVYVFSASFLPFLFFLCECSACSGTHIYYKI